MLGQRIKESLNHLKENGRVYGPTPFGFKRKGKRLLKDEEEQKVIRRIKMLKGQKRSHNDIAAHLNEVGYKTKKGLQWDWQAVNGVLRNAGS